MLAQAEKVTEKKMGAGFPEGRREHLKRSKETAGLRSKESLLQDEGAVQHSISEQFIHMLAPIQKKTGASASELSALNRLAAAVAESVEQDVISEEEAESILRYALSNFVEKKLEKIVSGLFSDTHSKWFLAASHHRYEREGG